MAAIDGEGRRGRPLPRGDRPTEARVDDRLAARRCQTAHVEFPGPSAFSPRLSHGESLQIGISGAGAMRTDVARNGRIAVMIVDDHPLLREGIAAVLQCEADIRLVAEADNGADAVDLYRAHRPDVVLMDLQMPVMDGVEATVAIRRIWPDARVVMLTTFGQDAKALLALKAGASGYLLKSLIRKDLPDAIRSVHSGRRHIPREVAAELAAHVTDDRLSEREVAILKVVAAGNSNREVAARFGISEDTVKAHMKHLMSKLGANDRTHAVTIAIRRGIIDV